MVQNLKSWQRVSSGTIPSLDFFLEEIIMNTINGRCPLKVCNKSELIQKVFFLTVRYFLYSRNEWRFFSIIKFSIWKFLSMCIWINENLKNPIWFFGKCYKQDPSHLDFVKTISGWYFFQYILLSKKWFTIDPLKAVI